MNHNYMIIEPEEQNKWGYEARMLIGNSIEGLLKFRIKQSDNKQFFYYEITSKQPLSRLLESKCIKSGEIRQILIQIANTLSKIEEYLLKEEQILLTPDYIYIDTETFTPYLCMLPAYKSSFPDSLTKLLQFFLEKVDHKDKESVVMAYGLYHESLKENYSMADLLKFLSEKKENSLPKQQLDLQEEEDQQLEPPYLDDYQYNEENTADQLPCRRNNSIKTELKNILYYLGGVILGPAALWFLKGNAGLRQYGLYLVIGELFLLAIIIIFRIVAIRTTKQESLVKKEPDLQRWQINIDSQETKTGLPEAEKRELKDQPGRIQYFQEEIELKTALLADFAKDNNTQENIAVLISLDEDWENIIVNYTPFMIGKSEELADYSLKRNTVSRLHLRIDKIDDQYTVTDLNSTNGIVVEERKLQANETINIAPGDIIYIADIGYRFSSV